MNFPKHIPTPDQIEALYQKYRTPAHVIDHCRAVARFSEIVAGNMQRNGVSIDIDLLKAAALLHDLVRVIDFKTFDPENFPVKPSEEEIAFMEHLRLVYKGMHHADVGADILRSEGFPEISELVRKHKYRQVVHGFDSIEEKVVFYADKRVKHTTVVPLHERLSDGRERNVPETIGTESAEINDKKVLELEAEIQLLCGITPRSPAA